MNNNFQVDKAIMAFKSQRFIECLESYEAALSKEYSKEAWIGLSMVKLHLLSDNQTAKDVNFSLDRTVELYPKAKKEIATELIKNAKYLIYKYTDLVAQLEVQIEEERRSKKIAAVATAASAFMGATSTTSKWSTRFNLATGAGLGYTLKKWSDQESSKVVQEGVYSLIKETAEIVGDFITKNKLEKFAEAKAFLEERETVETKAEQSSENEDLSPGELKYLEQNKDN